MVTPHDHSPDESDPWHRLEKAALQAHRILVDEAGACQEPLPGCPPWAHQAAMILLEALDDIDDMRHGKAGR